MKRMLWAALAATFVAAQASAVTVPFVEEFPTDNANWEDSLNNPMGWQATGGPDGSSYATSSFDFTDFVEPFPGAGPIVFRASGSDNASGGAFIGDWIAAGVASITAFVIHDAPVAMEFSLLRLAGAINFPAGALENTNLVQPNTWTQISWQFLLTDPPCTAESFNPTDTCADILDAVFNFQIGTNAPSEVIGEPGAGVTVNFGIDKVSLVPEPSTALMLGVGLLGLAVGRTRRD